MSKVISILLLLVLAGCTSNECNCPCASPTPEATVEPTPTVTPSPTPEMGSLSLSWDTKEERKAWTKHIEKMFSEEALFNSFDSAQDASRLCPNYLNLSRSEKVKVFSEFIVWVAYYESGWNPVSRMTETTMGTDPITKKQVASEGLLQLSYQDIQWAKFCKFDWSKDKTLADKDPSKTIMDPISNLDCGIRIMARQVDRKGKLILETGVYWAVIRDGGKYSKVDKIVAKTMELPFCRVTK